MGRMGMTEPVKPVRDYRAWLGIVVLLIAMGLFMFAKQLPAGIAIIASALTLLGVFFVNHMPQPRSSAPAGGPPSHPPSS